MRCNHFVGILCFLTLLVFHGAFAQQNTTIKGRIIDANSGEGIPFVNVYFQNSAVGATTDFDGYYSIVTSGDYDSLVASYIGYKTKIKPVTVGTQTINYSLEPDLFNLEEVVVYSGENPAWAILRNVVANKEKNSKQSLEAYEYESYTKLEFDIDNISDDFKNSKAGYKVASVMDSIATLKGENGAPLIPIFLSETISRFYVKNNPFVRQEEVKKTKISGVGVDDGSLISQLIGSSYQEYNFYRNWLILLEKEFVSPVADGWKMYYDYDILDTVKMGEDSCYQLKVIPLREQDPAFMGTIFITTDSYALKQLNLTIGRAANLNFIERINIQQELSKTDAGPWLPSKTKVLIDVLQPGKENLGFLAKFYISNKDWVVNQPKDQVFYQNRVRVAEDYRIFEDDYWEKNRHENLSEEEVMVYEMIDTLQKIPLIKSFITTLKIITTGYFNAGKVEFGPWLFLYANNNIEGHRFRLGFKTNINFSKKWIFKGYGAYGTKDQEWKYGGFVGYIVNRFPWTQLSVQHRNELERVGLRAEDLQNAFFFNAANRFGTLRKPYLSTLTRFTFDQDLGKGFSHRIVMTSERFESRYNFAYYVDPQNPEAGIRSDYDLFSAQWTVRYAKDESIVQNDNERISLGTIRAPIITLDFTTSVKDFLGSDFDYYRLRLGIRKKFRMGLLGNGRTRLNAGAVFGKLPYPLLENHIGNESMFYANPAYSTMNYGEFVSDKWVDLRYDHFFEGLLLNKIPLIKKLKLRLLGHANILWGNLNQDNVNLIPETDEEGNSIRTFNALNNMPYIELGYGIENIVKVLRIDFFHRITYLDNPEASNFAVKISLQFNL